VRLQRKLLQPPIYELYDFVLLLCAPPDSALIVQMQTPSFVWHTPSATTVQFPGWHSRNLLRLFASFIQVLR
jgi:hypothetical protein